MVDLDRFESQFRAAVKERPVFAPPEVGTVLAITDVDEAEAKQLQDLIRKFLAILDDPSIAWRTASSTEINSVRAMLNTIEQVQPDLIVSYRHLFEDDKDLPHSLGTYADMLTQALTTPVLLLPNPQRAETPRSLQGTRKVLAITDHIVGDQRLVNWALHFVRNDGQLWMANIEDDHLFKRYVEIIGKIPDIDTETASSAIEQRLIHEAEDFLEAWAKSIRTDFPGIQVETLVRLGHTTRDYMDIAREVEADLVVFNTREEGQLAMHGVAYALAVELLDTPLLML